MSNCWEIKKDCPFSDTDPAEANCPVYADQVPCWDFDWISFYRCMPDGSEKEEWKRLMLEWCASCEIRESHRSAIDDFLAALRSI